MAIFDSDGTLADTLPWMRSIFNDLAEEHGFTRVEPRDYHRFRDLDGASLLRELGLPLWKLPRVIPNTRARSASSPELAMSCTALPLVEFNWLSSAPTHASTWSAFSETKTQG
jgi:phosphoglycolate phosphatase-like HAD superfamily hydrolase